MKHLTLVRHAKSSWSSGATADFDRPLNARGKRTAPQIARHLAEVVGLRPDHVVSSPALRAITTAHIIAPALGVEAPGVVEKMAIYDAALQPLVYTVQELPSSSKNAMLFGHMPGVQELAHFLIGDDAIDHYPTCGVALLELSITNWNEAKQGCGTLIDFVYPKMLDRTD